MPSPTPSHPGAPYPRWFPRPRWTRAHTLRFGPNWGRLSPLWGTVVVWMILWIPAAFLGGFLAGVSGGRSPLSVFGPSTYAALIPAAIPGIIWTVTRSRQRSHYRHLLIVADQGGCASCGYGGRGKDPNLCPECASQLDHARSDAAYWHARL